MFSKSLVVLGRKKKQFLRPFGNDMPIDEIFERIFDSMKPEKNEQVLFHMLL